MIRICKYFILIMVLIASSCASKVERQETKKEQPNILFILSDDHTSQAWGIYGGLLADYVQNKNINRLASEGLVMLFVPIVFVRRVGGVF